MIWTVPAVVVRVVDGDTVICDLDLGWRVWRKEQSVRVLGIDSPERGTAGFYEAKEFAQELMPVGTHVIVESEKLDNFGRVLGSIMLPDGTDYATRFLNGG